MNEKQHEELMFVLVEIHNRLADISRSLYAWTTDKNTDKLCRHEIEYDNENNSYRLITY